MLSSVISTTRPHDHIATGDPVISIDTKKEELVGQFKNAGREWLPRSEAQRVNVHDFMDKQLGKAIPVRRLRRGRRLPRDGSVSAPTTTPPSSRSPPLPPGGARPDHRPTRMLSRLLITAHGGRSNGHRTRLCKIELARLAADDRADHHRVPSAAGHQ